MYFLFTTFVPYVIFSVSLCFLLSILWVKEIQLRKITFTPFSIKLDLSSYQASKPPISNFWAAIGNLSFKILKHNVLSVTLVLFAVSGAIIVFILRFADKLQEFLNPLGSPFLIYFIFFLFFSSFCHDLGKLLFALSNGIQTKELKILIVPIFPIFLTTISFKEIVRPLMIKHYGLSENYQSKNPIKDESSLLVNYPSVVFQLGAVSSSGLLFSLILTLIAFSLTFIWSLAGLFAFANSIVLFYQGTADTQEWGNAAADIMKYARILKETENG